MGAKKVLAIDIVVLLVYLVSANPVVTGIPLHEWIGLGVLVVFAAHFALHADWVVDTVRSTFRNPGPTRIGNLVVDVFIVVALVVCVVSGLFVSGTVLSTFGFYATGYFLWDPLHAVSAKVLLAFLLVHIVAHGRWILGALSGGRSSSAEEGEKDE